MTHKTYKTCTISNDLKCLSPIICSDLVRIGRKEDGGYVIPEIGLKEVDGVISFGVGRDWSFEMDMATRNKNLLIHSYDHTINKTFFMKAFVYQAIRTVMLKGTLSDLCKKWGHLQSYKTFFKGNHNHFQNRVFNRIESNQDVVIDTVFEKMKDKNNLVVKMDIEGDEYRILRDLMRYQDRISVLCVEFHNTDPLRDVFKKNLELVLTFFGNVHVHANNAGGVCDDGLPETLEITFLNKQILNEKGISQTQFRDRLPLEGLDYPCEPSLPEYELRF